MGKTVIIIVLVLVVGAVAFLLFRRTARADDSPGQKIPDPIDDVTPGSAGLSSLDHLPFTISDDKAVASVSNVPGLPTGHDLRLNLNVLPTLTGEQVADEVRRAIEFNVSNPLPTGVNRDPFFSVGGVDPFAGTVLQRN